MKATEGRRSDGVEARIEALEARCRRLQWGLGFAGVILGGACLAAFRAPDDAVVRARRFDLVNAEGQVRGRLEMDGTTPRLVLECPEEGSLAGISAGASPRKARAGDARIEGLGAGAVDVGWARGSASGPSRGVATLSLAGTDASGDNLWTELQVSRDGNSLFMGTSGPTAMLAAAAPRKDNADAFLLLCADRAEGSAANGSFGHATVGADLEGGYVLLGADDVERVRVDSRADSMIELHDEEEATLFRAP